MRVRVRGKKAQRDREREGETVETERGMDVVQKCVKLRETFGKRSRSVDDFFLKERIVHIKRTSIKKSSNSERKQSNKKV